MELELDLKDYLRIIRKRLILIICFVLIACGAAGAVSYYYIEPTYEASTMLIVNSAGGQTGVGGSSLNINDINFNIRLIETYKEIIKTPAIMETVTLEYPQLGLTTEQLVRKVKVSSVNNTQVMTLIVQDPSYELAADIVNAVSRVFQREIPSIMSVDNVSLLSEANRLDNPAPVKPNPLLNIAISFVVALMAAIGLAFLLEYLDDTIKTEEDVERYLNLPTLAIIPKLKKDDFQEEQASKLQHKAGETKSATTFNS